MGPTSAYPALTCRAFLFRRFASDAWYGPLFRSTSSYDTDSSGTCSVFPLYPALKRRAILKRPSGAGFSCVSFHPVARKLVLTHTLKRWATQIQGRHQSPAGHDRGVPPLRKKRAGMGHPREQGLSQRRRTGVSALHWIKRHRPLGCPGGRCFGGPHFDERRVRL